MFDWVVGIVEQAGYPGIAFLMFLENVFPPIPSEVIMPLAGFVAAEGRLNVWLVILSGSIGSAAGALVWYGVGLWLGHGRLERAIGRWGRWLTLTKPDLEKARHWFDRHGHLAVFFGRLVPTVRTLISVPAGIAEMRLAPFLLWTSLGTVAWTALLAACGYLLQANYEAVEGWLNPVSNAVVVLFVGAYVWRVATYKPGPTGAD